MRSRVYNVYRHAPFSRSGLTTSECMFCVILSLLPAAGHGIYNYGLHAALLIFISIASAVLCELSADAVLRKGVTISDYACIVTGLVGALLLPPSVPLYYPVIANVAAIIGAKMLFGGIGKNILNPAATGNLLLLIVFRARMSDFHGGVFAAEEEPLQALLSGTLPDLKALITGNTPGRIGTGSAVMILLGAAFLFAVGIVDILIPLVSILTFAVLFSLFGGQGLSPYYLLVQLIGGGFLFTAFFMANDYTTTPMSKRGKVYFAMLFGAFVFILRKASFQEESAVAGLLAANALVRLIDKASMTKPFGVVQAKKIIRIGTPKKRPAGSVLTEKEAERIPAAQVTGSETAGTISDEALNAQRQRRPVEHREPEIRDSDMTELQEIVANERRRGNKAARKRRGGQTRMEVMYKSTRSDAAPITASAAILKGLADDGGLFVPTVVPALDRSFEELAGMNYKEVAYEVMKLVLTDFTQEELRGCIDKAYGENFDTAKIAPIKDKSGTYFMELFHGPTIAFKDMALQILPHLMTTAAKKNHLDRKIVILTATSGDTGKAALAGFAGVPDTKIVVFYPKDGVSAIQKCQMVTQQGDNTCVIAAEGNFDNCQSGVKQIFTDEALREKMEAAGYQFSSANSINIGRLVPQIVYYVWAYTRLLRNRRISSGDEVNFVVPTGNFGDILAAYYAKAMGIPVHRLICASNSNKVLFDFFRTGIYDRNREFILTSSPSMDILISSNLERLIYHIAGDNAAVNAQLMKDLSEKGVYRISDEMRSKLDCFYGGYADEDQTADAIRLMYENHRYVIDPHTAVAASVYAQYQTETADETPTVIVSTASPFKFETSVMRALGKETDMDDLDLADELARTAGVPVPQAVASLRGAKILHKGVCGKDKASMQSMVEKFLGL